MVYHKLLLLMIALAVAGCSSSLWNKLIQPQPAMWEKIDVSEDAASLYGTVTVGTPRIADYDNTTLNASRQRLRDAIGKLR